MFGIKSCENLRRQQIGRKSNPQKDVVRNRKKWNSVENRMMQKIDANSAHVKKQSKIMDGKKSCENQHMQKCRKSNPQNIECEIRTSTISSKIWLLQKIKAVSRHVKQSIENHGQWTIMWKSAHAKNSIRNKTLRKTWSESRTSNISLNVWCCKKIYANSAHLKNQLKINDGWNSCEHLHIQKIRRQLHSQKEVVRTQNKWTAVENQMLQKNQCKFRTCKKSIENHGRWKIMWKLERIKIGRKWTTQKKPSKIRTSQFSPKIWRCQKSMQIQRM